VRDHPSHTSYAVSGGLWGARRSPLALLFNNRCVDLTNASFTSLWRVKSRGDYAMV